MLVVPNPTVKKFKETVPGELVDAVIYGEPSLGFITNQRVDDGDSVLGAWFSFGKDEPCLKYADTEDYCLSYGVNWLLTPGPAVPNDKSTWRPGVLGLDEGGWVMLLQSDRAQTELWRIIDGTKVRSQAKVLRTFSSYAIFASETDRANGGKPLFKYPG